MKETDWLPCHDDAEAWIVTLGPNDKMFTGGDDSYFRIWDLKSHEPIVEKRFMAGQTSCEVSQLFPSFSYPTCKRNYTGVLN